MSEEPVTDAEKTQQPRGLSVQVTVTDGIRVVTVVGEIDYHTGEQLRQALDVCDTARPRLVIDMRQVTFMDSSGINILIAAHQAITEAGGWLRLAGPAGPVLRALQIVGVDALIDCRLTLREALSP
ncbi:STAS domain-containing protein [Streptomyces swartbergensis]|uniref:Anti-sigma factor antagonist n=1 Tax=Streptomyces swartbergensis TaxID=487165 RepID=A0A243Q879_9ACTN|nr:STAS domain-containing protein [Streptomyces swartbergensis]OUC77783.1 anti-anti-sigma factor [Streptomyces swartbergensis]